MTHADLMDSGRLNFSAISDFPSALRFPISVRVGSKKNMRHSQESRISP